MGRMGTALAAATLLAATTPALPPGPVRHLLTAGKFDRLNAGLAGQMLDFTANHGVDRRLWSPALGAKRDVYVYLPPGYDGVKAFPAALWLHGLTWCWYLQEHPQGGTWIVRPWYPRKATPSFLDALAALRRSLWQHRITELSADTIGPNDKTAITQTLLDTLAYAA